MAIVPTLKKAAATYTATEARLRAVATGLGSLENQEEEEEDAGEDVEAAAEVEAAAAAAVAAVSSPGGAGELLVDGLLLLSFAAFAAVAAVIMPSSSLSSAIGEGGDLKPRSFCCARKEEERKREKERREVEVERREKRKHWRQGLDLSPRRVGALKRVFRVSLHQSGARSALHPQGDSKMARGRPGLARRAQQKTERTILNKPMASSQFGDSEVEKWFSRCLLLVSRLPQARVRTCTTPSQALRDPRGHGSEKQSRAGAQQRGGRFYCSRLFFSMACGKQKKKAKKGKSRSQTVPSPALLARRVETVAVLVICGALGAVEKRA